MKTFKQYIFERKTSCPVATYDIHVNLKNRQHAIDEYGYGPLNPMEPSNEFWKAKAKMWNVPVEYAKTARCHNCAAFNVSDEMIKCMSDGIKQGEKEDGGAEETVKLANLGYCTLFHFKCAGSRTCDAWLTNGPLDNKDV